MLSRIIVATAILTEPIVSIFQFNDAPAVGLDMEPRSSSHGARGRMMFEMVAVSKRPF